MRKYKVGEYGFIATEQFLLDVAKGIVPGHSPINKFGRAPTGVQSTTTDIWDRATAAPTQPVWLAPTAARIHNIASDNSADDGTPEGDGAGAQAIRIWGLKTWASTETFEDVVLNGTANVATANSYVIIHRMKIIRVGATFALNVGAISATAVDDATVTAQINDGEGQTQMAVYGIPSNHIAYLIDYYGTINKAQGAAATINFSFKIADEPTIDPAIFLTKNTRGIQSTGKSGDTWPWKPYMRVEGPAIVKVSGIASANDAEGSGGFNGVLVKN